MTPREVVDSFVEAINLGDLEKLGSLMTEGHVFIDSLGAEYHGRDAMRSGWKKYFAMIPDYRIETHETFDQAAVVVVVGRAHGSYASAGGVDRGDRWSTPAAWRAVVSGECVQLWQVFADNEPLRRAIRKYGDEAV